MNEDFMNLEGTSRREEYEKAFPPHLLYTNFYPITAAEAGLCPIKLRAYQVF